MSEDLVQSAKHPLGRFNYLRLGSTTLNQLKRNHHIKGKLNPTDEQRKPDGIIFLPRGGIKAVVEVKQPKDLTSKTLPKIIEKYSPIAKALCNLLIITDGSKTYWINPHREEPILDNGQPLSELFCPRDIESRDLSAESITQLVSLVEQCDVAISKKSSQLIQVPIVDPSQLANTVWQKIWVNTGKEPEKCLYNVVEIFVFKFLSDTGVLTGTYSFKEVIEKLCQGHDVALEHYARIVRHQIRKLFPPGKDNTTIINGTIFVNERGEPNQSQSLLFAEVIEAFQDFDNQNGSMRNINREFKTRLYETFLRQSAGIKSLGQYFTPRNVVQAIVRMAQPNKVPFGSRICDPFCGVGGFLLETIVESDRILEEFVPKQGKISPRFVLRGYDKGTDEKDDERTIILAKANMLIYFSDLLGKYNSTAYLEEFSEKAFNNVFRLIRSNLGTFGEVNDEPYDLILTNPPYVTSGSKSLRTAIDSDIRLSNYYPNIGRGTEALAMQWIIANLRTGGRAFVIVPDGLLNQSTVLSRLKEHCTIDGIVALPSRTFFSTPKKTYILMLTKKNNSSRSQSSPVFTYLISEIGESRDARRIPIEKNDLEELVTEFTFFQANPENFKSSQPRCKVVGWSDFDGLSNWLVDRLWTKEEKKALGLHDYTVEVDEEQFFAMIEETVADLQKFLEEGK